MAHPRRFERVDFAFGGQRSCRLGIYCSAIGPLRRVLVKGETWRRHCHRYQGLRLLDRARWYLLGRVADPAPWHDFEPPHRYCRRLGITSRAGVCLRRTMRWGYGRASPNTVPRDHGLTAIGHRDVFDGRSAKSLAFQHAAEPAVQLPRARDLLRL